MIKISDLYIYPIKSCAGIRLQEAELDDYGFRYDRTWMLTDTKGMFMSQRAHTTMALIQPTLFPDHLLLHSPDGNSYTLPFCTAQEQSTTVHIWEDSVHAIDEGDDVAAFLSEVLHTSCRLVRMTADFERSISPRYARNRDRVHFGDSQPLHLMNSASLDNLNRRLDTPVAMSRFRPNIVISGAEAFAEDAWRALRINHLDFDIPKATARCVMTTIDQQTAERGTEPLRTLARFRQQDNKVLMGIYLLHQQKHGSLCIGDSLEVDSK